MTQIKSIKIVEKSNKNNSNNRRIRFCKADNLFRKEMTWKALIFTDLLMLERWSQ